MSILTSLTILGSIGAIGAVTLNRVAKKFHIEEDPRIADIEALLPGANCGGCGMNGCHDFAVQCVKAGNLDGFYCPSAGQGGMKKIADHLGCVAKEVMPNVAVIHCAGTKETKTPLNAQYVGPKSCAIMNMTAGDYDCENSCLGCGDCVEACQFSALTIDEEKGIAVVNTDNCTGCGQCVLKCPRNIISLRPVGVKKRRVWVACSNCLKGAITRKQCKVGCIACGLCVRTCPFDAIIITDNHAYIDPDKCKTCGKCVPVCPTHAIHSANMIIRQKDESTYV